MTQNLECAGFDGALDSCFEYSVRAESFVKQTTPPEGELQTKAASSRRTPNAAVALIALLSENALSMRWSQYFIPTLREDPADAEVVSHKLLLRAGIIRQLSAGIYSYLPIGQRIALKVMQIVREEMNRIGGQEFYLPALHPAELWQESGRWSAIGDDMFRLKDRKGADMCLGMTHEEVITSIARNEIRSYKQLPQVWYQIQIKFRDEPRPKSGLMRLRTFIMKDAYSFDVDWEGLDRSFTDQREAYKRIFTRCGIEFSIVEASSGSMGGSQSTKSDGLRGKNTPQYLMICHSIRALIALD